MLYQFRKKLSFSLCAYLYCNYGLFIVSAHTNAHVNITGDDGGVVNVLEPHPFLPYLAISGLDNDVRVFMPIGEEPTNMSKYAKVGNQFSSFIIL